MGMIMSSQNKYTSAASASEENFVMTRRRPRSWVLTIGVIIFLFVAAAGVASVYLVGTHPGKLEPNSGVTETGAPLAP